MKQERSWNSILAVHEYFSKAKISINHLNKIWSANIDPESIYLPDCLTLYEIITDEIIDNEIAFDAKANPTIKYLFLRALFLEDIFPVKDLFNLEVIDCSVENSIDSLVPLKRLSKLREIHASKNNINNLEPISEMLSLQVLDLSANRITSIYKLYNLKTLKELLLNGNNIQDVSTLSNLSLLEHLDLSFNDVNSIKPLASLKKLQFLNLQGNNLDCKQIIELGKQIRQCRIFFDLIDVDRQIYGYLMIKNINGIEIPFLINSSDIRVNNAHHVYVKLLDNKIKININIIELMKNIIRDIVVTTERSASFLQQYKREHFFEEGLTFVRGQFDY